MKQKQSGFPQVDIMGTNPLKQQFEPTDAQPIRQRARMAGDPVDSIMGLVAGKKARDSIAEADRNTKKEEKPRDSILTQNTRKEKELTQ